MQLWHHRHVAINMGLYSIIRKFRTWLIARLALKARPSFISSDNPANATAHLKQETHQSPGTLGGPAQETLSPVVDSCEQLDTPQHTHEPSSSGAAHVCFLWQCFKSKAERMVVFYHRFLEFTRSHTRK